MPFAPGQNDKELGITVFGSLVTEMAPTALPAGVSPNCQDGVFVPGSWASRPGLARVFATPFPGSPSVTYGKSYVDPTGVIRNIYFTNDGNIWVENITSSPGVYSMLALSTPGCYAKSVTAFGREYIAISDGLNGQEVPLQYDGTNLDRVTQDGPGAPPTITNLIIAASTIASLTRAANIVTAVTTGAHGLLVGYQTQIASVPASTVGTSVVSIVINNESLPGIATITTSSAHGLVPGNFINLSGVTAAVIGTITNISRQGNIVTVECAAPVNISIGASVTISSVTNSSFNSSFIVQQVVSPNAFVYAQTDTDAISSGGNVQLNWPLPDTSTPTYSEVIAAPTSTTFQIQINYSDGTWTTGNVTFAWEGTFYVLTVPSTTSFTYQQYGPPGSTTAAGTVTPYGQVAPGQHQMQVLFLTRQGYITKPSPPVKFVANGGQYLSIANLPIGPSNVIARIIAFTGALGAYFFYIPTPAQVNGQVVSTSTQVNDNTTTTVTLDFSDNTLYAAIGISVPGNNLVNQMVLDSALGFGFYGSRLLTYGQRNVIQNLLSMSFDGGWLSGASGLPIGWIPSGGGASLNTGHFGLGWLFTLTASGNQGILSQSFYEDAYGAPIGTGNTQYTLRGWFKPGVVAADLTFTATISSASTSFSISAVINGSSMSTAGSWLQADFSGKTPLNIPVDMVLTIFAATTVTSTTLTVDELSIIYTDTPFLDTILYGSYVNNPEAFDGLSGKFGPSQDTRKVMDFGVVRGGLYLLTREPSGRLHETSDNNTTEPAGWIVDEVGANCGALSAFSLTKSQADDASAGGGEEWMAWASISGARIFGGDQPWKISQEIQPDWESINPFAATTVWAVNNYVGRVIYFGLPAGTAMSPNVIYPVNYRELDTPYQIYTAAPVHTSFSGKLVATDQTRKWTRWNMAMNGAALMYRDDGAGLVLSLFGGGLTPFGNVYTLSTAKMTDDDYGQIFSMYITAFIPSTDEENALQLGNRKMLAYLISLLSGFGMITVTALVDNLQKPWGLTVSEVLQANPRDMEWNGGCVTGYRMAFQFASSPITGTDNKFTLLRIAAWLRNVPHLRVRGN